MAISCLPSPTTLSALVLSAMQSARPSSLVFGSPSATEPATPSCRAHAKSTAQDCGASTSAPMTTLSASLGTNSVPTPTQHHPRPACPPSWPLHQRHHHVMRRDLPPGHHLTCLCTAASTASHGSAQHRRPHRVLPRSSRCTCHIHVACCHQSGKLRLVAQPLLLTCSEVLPLSQRHAQRPHGTVLPTRVLNATAPGLPPTN